MISTRIIQGILSGLLALTLGISTLADAMDDYQDDPDELSDIQAPDLILGTEGLDSFVEFPSELTASNVSANAEVEPYQLDAVASATCESVLSSQGHMLVSGSFAKVLRPAYIQTSHEFQTFFSAIFKSEMVFDIERIKRVLDTYLRPVVASTQNVVRGRDSPQHYSA